MPQLFINLFKKIEKWPFSISGGPCAYKILSWCLSLPVITHRLPSMALCQYPQKAGSAFIGLML